jgi:hypothetical protein
VLVAMELGRVDIVDATIESAFDRNDLSGSEYLAQDCSTATFQAFCGRKP